MSPDPRRAAAPLGETSSGGSGSPQGGMVVREVSTTSSTRGMKLSVGLAVVTADARVAVGDGGVTRS